MKTLVAVKKKQQEEGRPKLFLYLGLILFTVPNKIIHIKDNKIFEKWSQKALKENVQTDFKSLELFVFHAMREQNIKCNLKKKSISLSPIYFGLRIF